MNACYRMTLVGELWQVTRPHASIAHAFTEPTAALAFVSNDCTADAATVEIVIDDLYMVKQVAAARKA